MTAHQKAERRDIIARLMTGRRKSAAMKRRWDNARQNAMPVVDADDETTEAIGSDALLDGLPESI